MEVKVQAVAGRHPHVSHKREDELDGKKIHQQQRNGTTINTASDQRNGRYGIEEENCTSCHYTRLLQHLCPLFTGMTTAIFQQDL